MRNEPRGTEIVHEKDDIPVLEGVLQDVPRDLLKFGKDTFVYPNPMGIRSRGKHVAETLQNPELAHACEGEYRAAAEHLEREIGKLRASEGLLNAGLSAPYQRLKNAFLVNMKYLLADVEALEKKYPYHATAERA